MRTRLAFSASLLLFSTFLAAQECSSHIVVDPFDQKTSLGIDNLKAEDFDVHLGSAAVPVLSATQNFNNRVLVLLETSGSNDDQGISQMVQRVAELARRAPNSRRIAFGIFGERALIADTFSATQEERSARIDQLMAQTATLGKYSAVFDSLHAALASFGPHQAGDTIVLISDGEDVKSSRNANDITKEFTASGTRLLVMMRPAVGMARIPSRQFRWAQDKDMNWRRSPGRLALASLSSRTGGAFTGVSDHFFDFAWAGYMLELKATTQVKMSHNLKVSLRGSAASAHKGAFVYHPEDLPPCD